MAQQILWDIANYGAYQLKANDLKGTLHITSQDKMSLCYFSQAHRPSLENSQPVDSWVQTTHQESAISIYSDNGDKICANL